LPSGALHWTIRYTGLVTNGGDYARDILLKQNYIYATGFSKKIINSEPDAVTLKYNQVLGISPSLNELPSNFTLYQNYPNPFNNTTIIIYLLPIKNFISLRIYNSTGQLIKNIVNGLQQAGTYSIALNMEGLTSGVYLCRLSAGNSFSDTKKLIFIK
jgi:hypothetical protein